MHIYIYIYICVCVCIVAIAKADPANNVLGKTFFKEEYQVLK